MKTTSLVYCFSQSLVALAMIFLPIVPVAHAQVAGKEIMVSFDDCVRFMMTSKPERIEKFEQEYGLNDQQKARLKTALDSYRSEMEVVKSDTLSNEDRRDRKTNAIRKFYAEVEGLLSTEQRTLLLENTTPRVC